MGRSKPPVIPPDASAAFVANMEDVLEVYQRPHDPQRPLVCLDETSKQLIIETRTPILPDQLGPRHVFQTGGEENFAADATPCRGAFKCKGLAAWHGDMPG